MTTQPTDSPPFRYAPAEQALALELLDRNPHLHYVCTDPSSKQPVKGIPFKDAPVPLDYCRQHVMNGWPLALVPVTNPERDRTRPAYNDMTWCRYFVVDYDDDDAERHARFLSRMGKALGSQNVRPNHATVFSRSMRGTHTWLRGDVSDSVWSTIFGSRVWFERESVAELKARTVCTLWHPTRDLVELLVLSRSDDLRDSSGMIHGTIEFHFRHWMEKEKSKAGRERSRRARGLPPGLPKHLAAKASAAPAPATGMLEGRTFSAARVAEQCNAMKMFFAEDGGDYGLWRAGLGVIAHCTEDDAFAHAACENHPSYCEADTQEVLDNWRDDGFGATKCEAFDSVCACRETCPFWSGGKVPPFVSPIALGRPAVQAGQHIPARAPVRPPRFAVSAAARPATFRAAPAAPPPAFRAQQQQAAQAAPTGGQNNV